MTEGFWIKAPMWEEWAALTRLQWSGRIAFQSEADKWRSPYLDGLAGVMVQISDCGGKYQTSLEKHLLALEDLRLFCSLLLMRSYALMESHCKLISFIVDKADGMHWKEASRKPSRTKSMQSNSGPGSRVGRTI